MEREGKGSNGMEREGKGREVVLAGVKR